MRQRIPLFWPVNIVVGFIILVGLLLASVAFTPLSVLAIDPLFCPTNGPAQRPNPYPPYPECVANRASLLTGTAQAQNPATNTPTTQNNNNNNNNTNVAATNTPTATPTTDDTTVGTTPTGTATATSTTAPTTPTAENIPPTPMPTLAVPSGVETRVCLPGETIDITGEGEAGTPLIVTFAERPVGGGAVRSDGTYRITLRIGPERPGIYLVEVEERDSRVVLQEFACEVPASNGSPTPTPFAGNA